MTPLAHRIASELATPVKNRRFNDEAGLSRFLPECHCFDLTDVYQMASELAESFAREESPLDAFSGLAFLPAPQTFIEYAAGGVRAAFLLSTAHDGHSARVRVAMDGNGIFASFSVGTIFLDGSSYRGKSFACEDDPAFGSITMWLIYAMLSIINQPRRINQRVIMAHAGLQRRLRRAGVIGAFPLNAYREVTLKAVPKPLDASDQKAWVDFNSNCMPLHFVRAHRRRSEGMHNPKYDPNNIATWDLVPACWRGNAAFGIKLTKYKVAA